MTKKSERYNAQTLKMLEQAEILKLAGDHEAAIEVLEDIIMSDPSCSSAYEELGDNYLSLREMEKSKKALLESLRINDESANGHYLLGFLFSLEQNWSLSVHELRRADALHPNHPEILRCLGWSLFNTHRRRTQGLSVLERAKNLLPDDVNVLCDLGVCYMTDSQPQKAQSIFQKVIALAPDSDQAQECHNFLKMIQFDQTKSEPKEI